MVMCPIIHESIRTDSNPLKEMFDYDSRTKQVNCRQASCDISS